jgi:hypothetical protein
VIILNKRISRAAQISKPDLGSTNKQDGEETCIANISPRERLKRVIAGVIPFVMALAILGWLISTHADRLWRLPLFLLYSAAATGYFQWRDKT